MTKKTSYFFGFFSMALLLCVAASLNQSFFKAIQMNGSDAGTNIVTIVQGANTSDGFRHVANDGHAYVRVLPDGHMQFGTGFQTTTDGSGDGYTNSDLSLGGGKIYLSHLGKTTAGTNLSVTLVGGSAYFSDLQSDGNLYLGIGNPTSSQFQFDAGGGFTVSGQLRFNNGYLTGTTDDHYTSLINSESGLGITINSQFGQTLIDYPIYGAGSGLTNLFLGIQTNTTASYTVGLDERYVAESASAALVTLPTASAWLSGSRTAEYTVANTGSGTITNCTVDHAIIGNTGTATNITIATGASKTYWCLNSNGVYRIMVK